MIPEEAVEAAIKGFTKCAQNTAASSSGDVFKECLTAALEAAAPYMLIHVHHHDIEKHAESFNEGYETCMAQELADDPTTAQDWLDEKLRAAKAEAWEQGWDAFASFDSRPGGPYPANPHMLNNKGEK